MDNITVNVTEVVDNITVNVATTVEEIAVSVAEGLPEAPIDGKQYARKDAAWAEVVGGGGGSSLVVQATDPALAEPGLWIQTGLGAGGTDMTFWVEDGS